MDSTERLQDGTLVLRSQMGEESAFLELVKRYHGRLAYFIRRIVNNRERADDILQDVWLTIYRKLPCLRETGSFAVWAYKIARNHAIQTIRDERRYLFTEEELEIPAAEEENEAFSKEDADRLRAAIDKLSPEHKEVIILRFMEEMSYQEIAAVAGCQSGTVRSRIYYAKRALRREMENRNHE